MSPETDLPAVAPSGPLTRPGRGPEGAAPGEPGNGDGAGRDAVRRWLPPGRVFGVAAVAALATLVAFGVAALLGENFREALLIEVEDGPVGAVPTYSDAPREAARFFADRDTVTVTVPRDMTVADFLALYHLENNPGARAALRDQLGAAAPGDPLREGDRVTLPLTLRREDPSIPDTPSPGDGPVSRDVPAPGEGPTR